MATIVVAQPVLASDFDEYETMTAAWTSYTPVLTASSVNPTNYSSTGRWTEIGMTIIYHFQINAITSFTAGTGTYSISLPVNALLAFSGTSGTARLFDSSTGNAHVATRVAANSATTLGIQTTLTYAGALTNVAATVPWTWAVNDIIDGWLIYERS